MQAIRAYCIFTWESIITLVDIPLCLINLKVQVLLEAQATLQTCVLLSFLPLLLPPPDLPSYTSKACQIPKLGFVPKVFSGSLGCRLESLVNEAIHLE